MNVLIDTNIIIPLEDTACPLDPSLAEMRRLSNENGHTLFVHPRQAEDIDRDRNEQRRNIVLSRLRMYSTISSAPELTEDDLVQYGWRQSNENDLIDNLLLHALCRGAIHLLVTNDKDIHKKAKKANVQEQVHRFDQFLAFLNSQTAATRPPPFGIQDRFLYEFDVSQGFFDSLREGYSEFDNWYLAKAAEHRRAWCVCDNDTIHAICIYKTESSPAVVDSGAPLDGAALKLCTFKVGEAMRGRKLGERLLFAAFKYAFDNGVSHVYLHTFGREHELLVSLCVEYGFEFVGKYQGQEDVYVKNMSPPNSRDGASDPLSYAVKYYPNYMDAPEVRKFIIPILPEYHNDLFADTSDVAQGLFADDSVMYSPQANTIKKAYVCHSNTTEIRPGDLLFFYRTHDRKSVECVGVAEQIYRGQDADKVLPLVSKRTVYTRGEVEEWLRRETLVILFRFIRSFSPVRQETLSRAGIVSPIQSVRRITNEQYQNCFGMV